MEHIKEHLLEHIALFLIHLTKTLQCKERKKIVQVGNRHVLIQHPENRAEKAKQLLRVARITIKDFGSFMPNVFAVGETD